MKDYLGKEVQVVIDRPLGSKHPKYELYYPLNYGYLPCTISGDGEPIDAYILGEFEPLEEYKGTIIAIIHRRNDVEDKLVVSNTFYDERQVKALVEFQERFFDSDILMNNN